MDVRFCANCDSTLTKYQQKFCSRECLWAGRKSGPREPWAKTRICRICSVIYSPARQAYCSDKCKREARKRKFSVRLTTNSTLASGHVRRACFRHGLLEPCCSICGLDEWMGRKGEDAPLQLDHINGVNTDNRLENLRILCANCHAQTDTFCGRNHRNSAAQQ